MEEHVVSGSSSGDAVITAGPIITRSGESHPQLYSLFNPLKKKDKVHLFKLLHRVLVVK